MKDTFDVIILGAGPSGMNAAVCAARNGLKVLLIEKNGYPGGANTASLVGPLMTFHDGGRQVIKGIAQEIVERLFKKGGTLGHIADPIGVVSTITPVDAELLKQVYFEMLEEETNITALFHTSFVDACVREECVLSISVVNKSGVRHYEGKVFIDASGDADLAAACGVPFSFGRKSDGLSQPMTLMFTMENVNLTETARYVRENPEQFVMNKECDISRYLAVSGFFSLVEKARMNGDFPLPRDRVLFFQGVHPGEVSVNMTRVTHLSGINGQDMAKAEAEAHRQVDIAAAFLKKYIPGFSGAHLKSIAASVGVRESRRISGVSTLDTDMIHRNLFSEDSVAVCAYPIDIHDPAGAKLDCGESKSGLYDIPYGVMTPKTIKNLLVTGRSISASHEAIASARISATAMALGQAAGMAAAVCVKDKTPVQKADVRKIQTLLFESGAIPGKNWL